MRRTLSRCLGLIAVSSAAPAPALVWGVDTFAQVRFDDNLFRRPAPDRYGDRIATVGSGLTLTLPRGPLDATVEGRLTRAFFANSTALDHLGYSLAAHATYDRRPVAVEIKASRERRLSDFAEIYQNIKNMQTVTLVDGQATAALMGDIRAVAGGALTRSENSAVLTNGRGYTIGSVRGGLGYFSPSHNSIALLYERVSSRGLGTTPVDVAGQVLPYRQDFSENQWGIALHYQPSALIVADARIAHVDRHDRSLFHKDFSGLTGKLAVEWKPRRTIGVTATMGRQLQTDGYVYSDSVREDYGSLLARARVTNRIDAKLGYAYIRRRFVYDTQAPSPIEPRTDRFQRMQAGLTYDLSRRFALDLEGHREWRGSTNRQFRYADDALMLRLHVRLGTAKPAP